jgi:UDPglucose--hexose-1-phosphate uridylyltransferase
VIQSPTHSPGLPFLSKDRVRTVFEVYRERLRAMELMPDVRSIVLAENCGPDSGGSLSHPHGQLLATPELLPALERSLQGTERRTKQWGVSCPLELVVDQERTRSQRLVWEGEEFTVLTPFASTLPYQLRLVPRRHTRSLSLVSDDEIRSLAELLPWTERALLEMFPGTSYNVTGVFPAPSDLCPAGYHWSIDLLPRLVKEDAFELASRVPVNPIAPELAAERYRAALRAPR